MKGAWLAVPLLVFGVSAQAAGIKSEIDAANKKWLAAYNKGDAAAIAAMYTNDATLMPPGAAMAKGHDGARKIWQGMIQNGVKVLSLNAVTVEQHGNVANEIGRVVVEAPNAQKQMTRMEGKYVVVWKKVNGAWKLDTDIWNMNQ